MKRRIPRPPGVSAEMETAIVDIARHAVERISACALDTVDTLERAGVPKRMCGYVIAQTLIEQLAIVTVALNMQRTVADHLAASIKIAEADIAKESSAGP